MCKSLYESSNYGENSVELEIIQLFTHCIKIFIVQHYLSPTLKEHDTKLKPGNRQQSQFKNVN